LKVIAAKRRNRSPIVLKAMDTGTENEYLISIVTWVTTGRKHFSGPGAVSYLSGEDTAAHNVRRFVGDGILAREVEGDCCEEKEQKSNSVKGDGYRHGALLGTGCSELLEW
jgi:hypothetical protein